MRLPRGFVYYGVAVYGMEPNSSGLRYKTGYVEDIPSMRTDTKEGMKEHIRKHKKKK